MPRDAEGTGPASEGAGTECESSLASGPVAASAFGPGAYFADRPVADMGSLTVLIGLNQRQEYRLMLAG